ncbi:hypothetical protein EMPS_00312 [Entomortierella parvispora]|uniref:F-box domain-containing protein n=1 Tax=Entomortierella parvispora TaxID=205924 RepID=A0A9P3H0D7_9FUNG|nr:hypothetical protein EMPS_00312 [Entomortierella parvispora]
MHAALELPELRDLIGRYLSTQDLVHCMGTCHAWLHTFEPLLWSGLKLYDSRSYASADALQSHAPLISSLSFTGRFPDEYFEVKCSNLQSFSYCGSTMVQSRIGLLTKFIRAHKESLGSMDILLYGHTPEEFLWDAIAHCSRLESLALRFAEVLKQDSVVFWTSLQNLVSLTLTDALVPYDGVFFNESLKTPSLSPILRKLKHVYFARLRGLRSEDQMQLLEKCPNLLSIYWRGIGFSIRFAMERFTQYLQTGKWPGLVSLDVTGDEVLDELLAKMLQSKANSGVRKPQSLMLTKTGFGSKSFAAIQEEGTLVQSIQTLDLHACFSVSSKMLQKMLETMPNLKHLSADRICEKDIVMGSNWICHGLEHLEILIDLNDDNRCLSLVARQERMYDRLALLTRLKVLGVTRYAAGSASSDSATKMTHLLENGLGRLATLKRLRSFKFSPGHQWMSEDEILWMIKHWPQLESVSSGLTQDFGLGFSLIRQLDQHGIKTL